MSSSFTSVFSQIRLNSDITTTSGHSRVVVANNAHMLISDSGALASSIALTGQNLYNTLTGLSGVINSNNYIQYTNATGLYVNVATGSDTQYVPFGLTFSAIPKINLTLDINAEITSSSYGVVTSGRSTTGVYIIYSDSVSPLDTGLGVSMWIHI